MIRFNTLLDPARKADGSLLPEKALVVGLINTSKKDCYQGADFYSRFDKIEKCPIEPQQLIQSAPVLPIKQGKFSEAPFIIDLHNATDWKELLLGYWELNGDSLTWKKGALEIAFEQKKNVEIRNGLWTNQDFVSFWQSALIERKIICAGKVLPMPNNFEMKKSKECNWKALSKQIVISELHEEQAEILNPACYNKWFNSYE